MSVGHTKHCPRCERSLDRAEFYADRKRKDGLRIYCKQCCKESSRAWAKANPEQHRAQVRRWYAANRQKARALNRKWFDEHREERRAYYRRRYRGKRLRLTGRSPQDGGRSASS